MNGKQAQLAYETYDIAMDMLEDIMDKKWMRDDSKLIILGGLMINVDGSDQDYFQPIKFEMRTLKP